MKQIGFALLVYTAAVARTSVVPRLGLAPASDVLLALAFPAALIGGAPGLLWAAVIGLVSDAIAASPLGVDLVWTTFFAWLAQRWLGRRSGVSSLTKASLAFLLTAGLLSATALTRLWLASGSIDAALLAGAAAATALLSALLVLAGGVLFALPRQIFPARQRPQAW